MATPVAGRRAVQEDRQAEMDVNREALAGRPARNVGPPRSRRRAGLGDWAYLVGVAVRNLVYLRRRSGRPVRSILVLCMGGIGDVLWTTPVLRALRAHYPEATIAALVLQSRGTRQVLEGSAHVDECIVIGWNPRAIPGGLARLLRLLRARSFDMTISTYPGAGLGGRLLAYLVGAPIRAGYGGFASRLLLTVSAPLNRCQHSAEVNLDLALAVGLEVSDARFDLPLKEQDRAFAAEFLGRQGLGAEDILVGIHPGTFRDLPEKSWMTERFAQLIDTLQRDSQAKILLFGGPHDEVVVARILAALSGAPPVLATGLTLLQMAALFERCCTVVTNDSGPLHVAEAVDTPAVALFGPTDPALTGPYRLGDGRYTVINHRVPCGPCYSYKRIACPHNVLCMRLISVEEVARAVRECTSGQPIQGWRGYRARDACRSPAEC